MMKRNYLFNLKGVNIYSINNFLREEECDYLCKIIEGNHSRSGIAGIGNQRVSYSEDRTSSTSYFHVEDSTLRLIDQKIGLELGIPLEFGEPTQGQIYQEGEEFKNHLDYFVGDGYINQALASGQRTWTVMIYLNEVEEGGYTEFPVLGKTFFPMKGTAVLWKNSDGQGRENEATLHSGKPVIKGKKIIITKWFREKRCQPKEDIKLAEEYHQNQKGKGKNGIPKKAKKEAIIKGISPVKIEYVKGIPHARYGTKDNIPKITKEGFRKIPIPPLLFGKIYSFYTNGKMQAKPEFDPNSNDHLTEFITSKEADFPTKMIPLTDDIKNVIFDGLQDVLEDWAGRKIERTYCYGIRTYNRGAVLKKHTDGFETRIISSILNVDQKVDEPWALQIDDHEGVEHEVFIQPGEMVLYESAILHHGRVKPFKGDYFSNLFVHYVNLT